MKKIIRTHTAPQAIGPYNQAVIHKGIVYVSGQIPLDPNTNSLVDGNIEVQTKRVLENIKAILDTANSDLDKVLMCQVYVKNMDDYAKINAIYASYFDEKNAPARALVEVTNLPKNVDIEISVIAAQRT